MSENHFSKSFFLGHFFIIVLMSQNHFCRQLLLGTSNHRKSLTSDPPKIISIGLVQSFQNHFLCTLPTPQNHFKQIISNYDFEGLELVLESPKS